MMTRLPGQLRSGAYVALIALALSCASVSAFAQTEVQGPPVPQIQTLQSALRDAYVKNPTLQAARAELRATEELLPQAQAGFKPTVNADASIITYDVDDDSFGDDSPDGTTAKDIGLSLNQPVFRGGRTFAETASAKHVIAAQEAFLMVQEQEVLLAAVTAYLDVLRDRAVADLRRNNSIVIGKQLEAARNRFEVGEITKTDVSQAQARLAEADSNVITAEGNLRATMAVYEQIIGSPAGNLEKPGGKFTLPASLDEAIEAADRYNPKIRTATSVHEASEKDVDGQFGRLLPEIGLVASSNKTYDPSPGLTNESTTSLAGLRASIPLYEAGATRSRVRQAKHTANQRYLEILETRRLVRQEAVRNWEALQTARAEIKARTAQAEASAIAQQGVRSEAEYGTRSTLDALDADQEALDAQVALVTAQRNETVATFALMATLGAMVPENLGFTATEADLDVDRLRNAD